MWVCQEASSHSFFWEIFIFSYLFMLQIIGIVLAFQTRRVKFRGLRDSKEIAAIVYISSIAIVVMALENFTLTNYINIGTGIFVFSVFVLTTIFLVLIFVPKVRIRHPSLFYAASLCSFFFKINYRCIFYLKIPKERMRQ